MKEQDSEKRYKDDLKIAPKKFERKYDTKWDAEKCEQYKMVQEIRVAKFETENLKICAKKFWQIKVVQQNAKYEKKCLQKVV